MSINEINTTEAYKEPLQLFNSTTAKETLFAKKGGKLVKGCKVGNKIRIKPENKGKFTKSAKAAGQSVQEHATSVLNNPHATTLQKRRANFAKVAKTWHHGKGK